MTDLAQVYQLKTNASKVVDKFLRKKRERSVNTAINYSGDIAHFVSQVFNKKVEFVTGLEWNKLDEEMFVGYFDKMYQDAEEGKIKCKNITLNRKMSSIKELIKYLKRNKVITSDISFLESIENYIDDTEPVEAMPLDVAKQYAEYFLNERYKSYEKHCLCLLAIDTGLRLTELLTLKKSQFIIDEVDDFVVFRGRGKGNKMWTKKISRHLYEKLLKIDNKGENIFTLSSKNVIDMMQRAKIELKHEKRNYSFHSFKKTAVTFGYRRTGDIMEAKKIGNHTRFDTVVKYVAELDYGVTGAISLGENLNPNLYKEVDYDTLIKALDTLKKYNLFLLNLALNDIIEMDSSYNKS